MNFTAKFLLRIETKQKRKKIQFQVQPSDDSAVRRIHVVIFSISRFIFSLSRLSWGFRDSAKLDQNLREEVQIYASFRECRWLVVFATLHCSKTQLFSLLSAENAAFVTPRNWVQNAEQTNKRKRNFTMQFCLNSCVTIAAFCGFVDWVEILLLC